MREIARRGPDQSTPSSGGTGGCGFCTGSTTLPASHVISVIGPSEMLNDATTSSPRPARLRTPAPICHGYYVGDDTISEPGQAAHKSGSVSLRHGTRGVALPPFVRRNSPATRNAADGTSFSTPHGEALLEQASPRPRSTTAHPGGLPADRDHEERHRKVGRNHRTAARRSRACDVKRAGG